MLKNGVIQSMTVAEEGRIGYTRYTRLLFTTTIADWIASNEMLVGRQRIFTRIGDRYPIQPFRFSGVLGAPFEDGKGMLETMFWAFVCNHFLSSNKLS